jgi:hypothetical protein
MSKKSLLIAFIALSLSALSAQVFNTAGTLKPGTLSLGLNPAVFVPEGSGDSEFELYVNGGYGLSSGIDFNLRFGTGPVDSYFGADVEYRFYSSGKFGASFAAGAHTWNDFGLDATLNMDYKITRSSKLFFGVDADYVFGEDENYFPAWAFVGVDLPLSRRMAFIFSSDIAVSEDANYHTIHGGLEFYF